MSAHWNRDESGTMRGRGIQMARAFLFRPLSTQARSWTTVGAACVFIVVFIVAIRAMGVISLRPRFLLLAAFLTPLLQLGNAAEYRILGRFVGQKVGWWEALEITTLATAANLLPVPGGALLKIREMGGRSGRVPSTAMATALIGAFWLGAACAVAAFGLALLGRTTPAIIFAILAPLMLALGSFWSPNAAESSTRTLVVLEALQLAVVLTASVRLVLVMAGIGIEASLPVAMVLAASGPLAAIFGFFPGGLGLQELLAGALAPVAAVAPEIGAVSVATDRLVGYAAMAVGAALVWLGASLARASRRA